MLDILGVLNKQEENGALVLLDNLLLLLLHFQDKKEAERTW